MTNQLILQSIFVKNIICYREMNLQLIHTFCNKHSGISSIQDFIADMIK